MSTITDSIEGFVCGDPYTVTRTVESVPAGNGVVNAWLVVKRRPTDADANALLTKGPITPTLSVAGQITVDGGTTGIASLTFQLAGVDTALLTGAFWFGVKTQLASQVTAGAHEGYTPIEGFIKGQRGVKALAQ